MKTQILYLKRGKKIMKSKELNKNEQEKLQYLRNEFVKYLNFISIDEIKNIIDELMLKCNSKEELKKEVILYHEKAEFLILQKGFKKFGIELKNPEEISKDVKTKFFAYISIGESVYLGTLQYLTDNFSEVELSELFNTKDNINIKEILDDVVFKDMKAQIEFSMNFRGLILNNVKNPEINNELYVNNLTKLALKKDKLVVKYFDLGYELVVVENIEDTKYLEEEITKIETIIKTSHLEHFKYSIGENINDVVIVNKHYYIEHGDYNSVEMISEDQARKIKEIEIEYPTYEEGKEELKNYLEEIGLTILKNSNVDSSIGYDIYYRMKNSNSVYVATGNKQFENVLNGKVKVEEIKNQQIKK
jgi:hypothetical protein